MMDFTAHVSTAALAVGAWELAKQVLGISAKRFGDQRDNKRKILRDDLSTAANNIFACLELAIEYYVAGCGPTRRQELSRQIRHAVQEFSMLLHRANIGLTDFGQPQIESAKIIAFRQSLTLHLDSVPAVDMTADDPRITAMYRAGHQLSIALTRLQYAST